MNDQMPDPIDLKAVEGELRTKSIEELRILFGILAARLGRFRDKEMTALLTGPELKHLKIQAAELGMTVEELFHVYLRPGGNIDGREDQGWRVTL